MTAAFDCIPSFFDNWSKQGFRVPFLVDFGSQEAGNQLEIIISSLKNYSITTDV